MPEDVAGRPIAAREQEAEARLVHAVLRAHRRGGEAHLPPGMPLARLLQALEDRELDTVAVRHAKPAVPFPRVVHAGLLVAPDRLGGGVDIQGGHRLSLLAAGRV
jgi:hypothetical protein